MYYYKVKKDLIYKYEVNLNLIKLQKLKNEIMENCSVITHKEYETTNPPKDCVDKRNYIKRKIGIKINDHGVSENFLVKYDEYTFSPLVHYIVDVMLGQTRSIEKIENFKENVIDFDYMIKCTVKEQEEIIDNLDKVGDTNLKIHLLASKRKELLYYINQKKLNKNRINAEEYIQDVLSCIHLKEIGTINISDVLKVTEFLEDFKSETMTGSLEKKLIRNKK